MHLIRNIRTTKFIFDITGEFLHYLAIGGLICAVDQMVKSAIDSEPESNFPREMPKTGGKVQIMRAHNPGFSQGRLGNYPEFVEISSLCAVSFLAGGLQLLTKEHPHTYRIRKLGMATVIGGAMSNVLDRIVNGKVTDYINIRYGFLKRMIVNIGDLAIYLGGILYVAGALFGRDDG
jgi:signal peptidase II